MREVEDKVRTWHKAQQEPDLPASAQPLPPPPPVIHAVDVETLQLKKFTDDLRSHFSTQVQIKPSRDGGGRIELAYYSKEDLERLLELLMP